MMEQPANDNLESKSISPTELGMEGESPVFTVIGQDGRGTTCNPETANNLVNIQHIGTLEPNTIEEQDRLEKGLEFYREYEKRLSEYYKNNP